MKIKKIQTLLISILFFTPFIVGAQIEITEIAWMGTLSSANDEWIEIYNSGGSSVDLSGWTLNSTDGTPSITLSGTLGSGSYGLLERTDDTSEPSMNALTIYIGAMTNTGESFVLKDGGGVTIQSLSFASGWPAGDSTTKETMQWNGSTWITAGSNAGSGTTGGGEIVVEEEEETTTSTSGGSSTPKVEKKVYSTMALNMNIPRQALVGAPVYFEYEALDFDRDKMFKGKFVWNLGDGTTREFYVKHSDGINFSHTYEHVGTYVANVKYYRSILSEEPDVVGQVTIEVTEPLIEVSKIGSDGSVEIKNTSSKEVDLTGWQIKDTSGNIFSIPDGTMLLGGVSITFSRKVTKLNVYSGVTIFTPSNTIATTNVPKPKTIVKKVEAKTVVEEEIVDEDREDLSASVIKSIDLDKKQAGNNLVYILAFVILILISVIAVLMLRRSEDKVTDSGYELVD